MKSEADKNRLRLLSVQMTIEHAQSSEIFIETESHDAKNDVTISVLTKQ